jgi:uncharacterized DUF497 family protein
VRFADAVTALENERAITIEDASSDEERWITLASDTQGRALVVVYTCRERKIRLISARKATPRERKQLEAEHEE